MDLDCQEALKTIIKRRRDVRAEFTGDPLGEEKLVGPLSMTRAALSVGNSQPWGLVIARDPATLDAFAEHAAQYRQDYTGFLDGEQREKLNPIKVEGIRGSGMGIIATYDPTRFGPNALGHHTTSDAGMFSVVYVAQNLQLMATALDLGVEWVSFYQEPSLKELLGLPEQVRPVGWLCVGRVAKLQEVPGLIRLGWSHRIALEEIVHRDRW